MMERFEELAHGATTLRVRVSRGDISVRVEHGTGWGLEWSSSGDAEPVIERDGTTVSVRQGSSAPAGGQTSFGTREARRPRSASSLGAIAEEITTDAVRWIGGMVNQRLDLTITVPADLEDVNLRSGLGAIDVAGLRNRIQLDTGAGNISLNQASGSAAVKTGSGEVVVKKYDGDLTVSTGSGRIVLAEAAGRSDLNTDHGEIRVDDARSLHLRAASGMGAIVVERGTAQSLRLNTGMGEISCSARLEPGEHDLKSGLGDITVDLDADSGARIDAQTGYGQVRSDIPLVRVGRSGPLGFGGLRMVGSIAGDDPGRHVMLRTGKGDIYLRRVPSRRPVAGDAAERRGAAPSSEEPELDTMRSGLQPSDSSSFRTGARGTMLDILERLARGEISPAEAEDMLFGLK